MTMDSAINVQYMKSFQLTENVSVKPITLETPLTANVNWLVQQANSNTKEDVLNVHLIFNTDLKSTDVLVQMDSIWTLTVSVRKLFWPQLSAMLDFTSIHQEDVLHVQSGVRLVQGQIFA